ncbi:medium-chain acyl-CoA ligase ACSF2, mitochondrial-like [Lineus longissimus]|uniref:medium-chain acyl-CoA ligase ACSF2, mitochondrial-like n=1 Tax=Lineus longissimus TaxID=88925 RepID=UPI00315CBB25
MPSSKLTRSYYRSPSWGVDPMQYTPAELLDIRGAANPDKEAIVVLDVDKPRQAITFGELKTKTEQLAAGLIREGLQTGDRVALLCPTSLEYSICEYAMARTGAILIRFHVSVKSSDSVKFVLNHTRCRWLIALPGDKDENYRLLAEMIPGLAKQGPLIKLTADLPNLETIFLISSDADSYPGTVPWTTLFTGIQDGDLDTMRKHQATIDSDMIHGCYCTSGSTGNPKFVAISGHWMTNSFRAFFKRLGVNESDRMMSDRPMFYVGGSTIPMLSIGCTFVSVKTATTGPEAQKGLNFYFKCLEVEGITVPYTLPYMLPELLGRIRDGMDVSKIKVGMTSGQVIRGDMLRSFYELDFPIVNEYGGTEAEGICSTLLSDPIDIKVAKTGIGLDNEIKIIDENGVIVPVGTEGEVCVRSPFMFVEYLGDEERTSQAKDSMGWYHTDDNGVMDENGYLTIHGRKSEVITKATVKIYPSAIEKVIREHTKIRQVVASGIPHPVIKEEICLCIVAESGADLTAEDVRVYCKEKFQGDETGSGSMPDYVLLFDKFPAGATAWKTERRKIRAEAVQRIEADREGCRI